MRSKDRSSTASSLKIIDVEQGSKGWFEARLGLATASNFAVVMAEGRDGNESLTRAKLMHRLAGEIITGEPAEEVYRNQPMDRGKEMEPAAIADYEARRGLEVRRVGFGVNFDGLRRCGASPDGLVGFDGVLETKTMRPDLMIPLLMRGAQMLPEHRAQCQGVMWVFEREWCDLKIFWPRMPDFTVRVHRDDRYIKDLSDQVERFNHELRKMVERLRAMGAGQ